MQLSDSVQDSGLKEKSVRSLPIWLRYTVIFLLAVGIFFRFYHLDRKVYWIDETNSSLRTLGYTKTEVIEEVFTGKVVSAETLQQYQRMSPEKGWGDTLNALMGTAEHTPLYFLLSRFWIGIFGHSIATMRCLTAIFSVLALPCLYWLCRELFESPAVGWIAMGLVAISPLHVLYAQEARPYSLLTVMTLLSSTLLLRALRTQTRLSWVFYGMTLALGLYTQFLFTLVAIAQGIYVLVMEKWRFSSTVRSYLITAVSGLLAFTPWIAVFMINFTRVQASTASLNEGHPLGYMMNRWFLAINQAFLDRELGAANFIMVLLVGYAIYFLCRHAPKRAWLFVVALIGVSFLALAIPDVILGGRRSIRIRYLFPYFLGIQIAFAYLFASVAVWASTWQQKGWRLLMIVLFTSGTIACIVSSQAVVWWNKSIPRSSYYPLVGEMISRSEKPLVISDGSPTDTLALSYWLDPDVKLQLSLEPRKIRVAQGYDPIYLLNPSDQTKKILTRRGYDLTLIYEDQTDPDDVEDRLWTIKPGEGRMIGGDRVNPSQQNQDEPENADDGGKD